MTFFHYSRRWCSRWRNTWCRNNVTHRGATQPVLNDSPTTVDQDTTYYTYTVEVAQTASRLSIRNSESVTVLVKKPSCRVGYNLMYVM